MAEIRCPSCKVFLAEVHDFGRSVCPDCGYEVTVRSKAERTIVQSKRFDRLTSKRARV